MDDDGRAGRKVDDQVVSRWRVGCWNLNNAKACDFVDSSGDSLIVT